MGFTSMILGSCNYHLDSLYVGGRSQLTDAYVDLEYSLTYSDSCGHPFEQAPFCTFSQVTEEVICDTCNVSTGLLACNPALPPFTGTCTTDSNLVRAARPLLINSFAPAFLTCLEPQCDDYYLNFTLKNRDSTCGDVCGYLCATGNMWRMTIEACRIHGDIEPNPTQVCAGQPVTFTATPLCGVPPYHYVWLVLPDTASVPDTITIYDNNTLTLHPEVTVTVLCYLTDTCGENWQSSVFTIPVTQSPSANAGNDTALCGGGATLLGGNPTTTGATVRWAGLSPASTAWLSSPTALNPTLTIPPGEFGDFAYVVTATNSLCFRTDTIRVISDKVPLATIDTTGPIIFCSSQSVQLAVQEQFASYLWSNGATTQSISINQVGTYSVIVTDTSGCKDTTSGTVISDILPSPSANAGADTFLCEGGSLVLGGNPTTTNATVQWAGDDAAHTAWLSSTTAFNPTVTIPDDTTGAFTYIVTASNTQCNRMDTVTVFSYPNPVPVIDTTGKTVFCAGQNVQLAVEGTYAKYLWNTGSTAPFINISQTGSYFVTVTDSNGCTAVSSVTQVSNNSPPVFSIFPDTSINYGDSVMLSSNINLSAASIDSFTWYPQVNITCLTCTNPFVAPKSNQIYGLTVFSDGCVVSDSLLIAVILPDNFFIPNVFSPNGDGNNDYFYIYSQAGVTVYTFQVYDRWGEKVHDGTYPWDGLYRGKPAPEGVYTYVLTLSVYGDQNLITRKGSVTLLR
jgi:gliding motility-associated-like protein